MVELARHRLCLTIGNDVLSSIQTTMIDGFIVGNEFDVVTFLSREIRDYGVGGEKALLAYPCMITQLCLDVGILKHPRIDEIIEAM